MSRVAVLCVCLALCLSSATSARILGLFTSPSKSHLIIHMAVAKTLADQGHNVTVVTTMPYDDPDPNPNYRNIRLDIPGFSTSMLSQVINKPKPMLQQIVIFMDQLLKHSEDAYLHPHMQQLMNEEQFDLVIMGYFMNDFYLGIAAHFKCPIIIDWMTQPISPLNLFVGNPNEMAYVPNSMTGLQQPMGFLQRLQNFLVCELGDKLFFQNIFTYKVNHYYDKHFPSTKYPSLAEMKKNVSLLMVNNHFSQGVIMPNVPAVIEIGGIQINEKLTPLPEDIQTFLDAAEDLVIYFSFGTNVGKSALAAEKVEIIFNVLSKLPYKVLAKWDEDSLPTQSKNILFKSWFPQDSVLAHPKVQVFVTHGGKGSVVESEYHGVPMVGIALFGDQLTNMQTVAQAGYGVSVDYFTLSEDSLRGAIEEVIQNKSYRDRTQKFAQIYKDRPMTARQTVAYWVDYVIRHRGAPHMQSPLVHLNWFQAKSLDVIAFLAAVLYIVLKIIAVVYRLIKSCFVKKDIKVKTN